MKSASKSNQFDYSKYDKAEKEGMSIYIEDQYWGFHSKKEKLSIDIKRFLTICKRLHIDISDFESLLKQVKLDNYSPTKTKRNEYLINKICDSINVWKSDWINELKPFIESLFDYKNVMDSSYLSELSETSDSNSFDDIRVNASLKGIKRYSKNRKIVNYISVALILKIASDVDRIILSMMTSFGFEKEYFDIDEFKKFSNPRLESKKITVEEIEGYSDLNSLRLVNNFLKHSTISCYNKLKKAFPHLVINKEYTNGLFAGDFLNLDDNFIDNLFDKLIIFFKNYCQLVLYEDVSRAPWDYDDYFYSIKSKYIKEQDI